MRFFMLLLAMFLPNTAFASMVGEQGSFACQSRESLLAFVSALERQDKQALQRLDGYCIGLQGITYEIVSLEEERDDRHALASIRLRFPDKTSPIVYTVARAAKPTERRYLDQDIIVCETKDQLRKAILALAMNMFDNDERCIVLQGKRYELVAVENVEQNEFAPAKIKVWFDGNRVFEGYTLAKPVL